MAEKIRDEMMGALVGWNVASMGQRLVLTMQSVTKAPPHKKSDVALTRFVLDRNQAVQLGNYLFEYSGQMPPRRKSKRLLDRILGA